MVRYDTRTVHWGCEKVREGPLLLKEGTDPPKKIHTGFRYDAVKQTLNELTPKVVCDLMHWPTRKALISLLFKTRGVRPRGVGRTHPGVRSRRPLKNRVQKTFCQKKTSKNIFRPSAGPKGGEGIPPQPKGFTDLKKQPGSDSAW